MRKVLLIAVMLLCARYVFAEESVTGKNTTIGLAMPVVGWTSLNENGEIKKIIGINGGVGITVKNYFQPMQYKKFNTYFTYGTVFVLVPYIGVGGDYVFNNGLYIGAGTVWLAPEIHIGYMF